MIIKPLENSHAWPLSRFTICKTNLGGEEGREYVLILTLLKYWRVASSPRKAQANARFG